jgi:gamma-glutamyltranspeptidase/glutathione hydrolase
MPSGKCAAWLLILCLCLAPSALAQQQPNDVFEPEAATPSVEGGLVRAERQMVAAAHPLAADAGLAILRQGGNAIDAMVTTQLVLGLVEPQSSGIGGGAFLVFFDAGQNRLTTFDGRETAPAGATPLLFLDDAGEPLAFMDAVVGGRSVGTPGTVRLLFDTHERYGQLPWRDVVQPAIDLADEGFAISPRLNALIAEDAANLSRHAAARDYFLGPDGAALPVGHRLVNTAYAGTLRSLAEEGAAGFYEGAVAAAIADTVQTAKGNPGTLSATDLANYAIVEREPVCVDYRDLDVCGMGPPSSGALTIGQILGLVEPHDIAGLGPDSPEAWRLIGDASRLAFADRGRYMADIDFVPMPLKGLLDRDYLAGRGRLLDGDAALPDAQVEPGSPPWDHALLRGDDIALELPSTTHFSIVDDEGNVVSMTSTIESGFGSRLMTGGFLLNNELTDFSFATHDEEGQIIANAVAPGKRPRSSMAPTIVMQDGEPLIAVGSPGGSRIIGYVAQALIALIDWEMDAQQAVAMPHLVNRFGPFDVEAGTAATALSGPLRGLGYTVNETALDSGLHAIVIGAGGLEGGADPRREGVARGD